MVIELELNQLQEILGNDMPKEASFLSEINKNTESPEQKTVSFDDKNISQEKSYTCKYCKQEGFKSLPELMRHSRTCSMRPPKEIKELNEEKEKNDNNKEGTEEMPEETDISTSIERISPLEIEESKKKKDKKKDVTTVLTLYDRLENLLKGYQVKGVQGIIQSANMYDIGSNSFIPILKDLLRNTSTAPGLIGNIADAWSQIVGIKTETDITKSLSNSSTGQNSANEVDSVLRQMELDEARSLAMGSRRSMIEERELNNEMKRKRLSGELMENKNSPDISKLIELEMLKYQFMQPKANPEIDMLKLELERLKTQNMQPKSDGQVELLKQQLELQNKKYEDIQRKIEEDSRLSQLKEEARKDREALEKRLEEQAKQTQELIKATQAANAPKTEDLLKQQMGEMQRQFNEQLAKLNNDFLNSRREEQIKTEMEKLKEDNKRIKEESQSQVGSLAESMKEFATNMTHAFEKSMLEKEHERKEDELKKKLSDLEHNKSLTNEQYVFEKTSKIAEEVGKSVAGALGTFGEALKPSVQKSAESASAFDKANLALQLKQQGFSDSTIASIVGQQNKMPLVRPGSAAQAYQDMQKVVDKPSQTNVINIPEITDIPADTQVRFNTEPDKGG